jgi:DNA processing protein
MEVRPEETGYPKLLKELSDAPSPLYFAGTLPGERDVTVAIVGTRKATRDGLLIAKRIGNELAKAGVTVVSGLALGIDGAAHEGVIAARGRTVAVLGTGADVIYPAAHENLAREILENGGAIVSEYPWGTPALPYRFLERNRLISGLSIATVVIEAPMRSGALVTARFALEQGRELFVVPGPVNHENYRGSHAFLREGARLATSAREILEDLEEIIANHQLELPLNEKKKVPAETENENDIAILKALEKSPESLTVDNLAENTNLEIHIVNQRLTLLIIKGSIEEKGGRFRLK